MLKTPGGKGLMLTGVFAALCLAIWFIYNAFSERQGSGDNGQDVSAVNATMPSANALSSRQGALDLVLKDINLTQGEGGFELWRLHAEWANMHKQDGLVFVDQPRLTYFMREEGKILYVRSESGDIEQETQVIHFVDKVHVTQDDKNITGSLLVYNGTDKTMTLPHGGDFFATGVNGTASRIRWFINDQLIEAEGDVTVTFGGKSASAEKY